MLIVSKRSSILFHQLKVNFLFLVLVDHVPVTMFIILIYTGVRLETFKSIRGKCAKKAFFVASLPQLGLIVSPYCPI